jgi:hypothetical protein
MRTTTASCLLAVLLAGCTPTSPVAANVPLDTSPFTNPALVSGVVTSRAAGGTVTGRVIDERTKAGVPDALVQVQNVTPPIAVRTDAGGNFTLPNVPQGPQNVTVDKADYVYLATSGPSRVEVVPGASVAMPVIGLSPAIAAVANAFIASIGGMTEPYGLAVDSNHGWLYVVDRVGLSDLVDKRCEVKKFTLQGGFVKRFGGDEVGFSKGSGGALDLFGHLSWAYGLDVDAGGNVYVADANKDRVVKFNQNGEYQASVSTSVVNDYDVAVRTDGQVVVSSSGNSKLQLFDANLGGAPKAIAGTGSNADVNGGFRGVTVDNGNFVYVVDNAAGPGGAIKKLDTKSGVPVLQFGTNSGNGPSQFRGATDLAVDNRNGDIYVVDSGNNRIQRFNSAGRFTNEFGSVGHGNGQFDTPYGIAIDKDGYVYVADKGNKRIQTFAPGLVAGAAPVAYPSK